MNNPNRIGYLLNEVVPPDKKPYTYNAMIDSIFASAAANINSPAAQEAFLRMLNVVAGQDPDTQFIYTTNSNGKLDVEPLTFKNSQLSTATYNPTTKLVM